MHYNDIYLSFWYFYNRASVQNHKLILYIYFLVVLNSCQRLTKMSINIEVIGRYDDTRFNEMKHNKLGTLEVLFISRVFNELTILLICNAFTLSYNVFQSVIKITPYSWLFVVLKNTSKNFIYLQKMNQLV